MVPNENADRRRIETTSIDGLRMSPVHFEENVIVTERTE